MKVELYYMLNTSIGYPHIRMYTYSLVSVLGVDRFSQDIELMIGHSLHGWWRVMWKFVTPAIMVVSPIYTRCMLENDFKNLV